MLASRILGTTAALVLSAVLLSACAGAPDATPEQTGNAKTPTTSAPAPTPSATSEPTADAAEPTCDTLIGEAVIADYESVGWTSQASPLYIGSTEIEDGLQCMWADFEGPAGDHGQMFGWAPVTESEAEELQDELVSQGWRREDGPEGVYITESPDTAVAPDADGYGMTYYFTEGQVIFAGTKQALLLVEWPKG